MKWTSLARSRVRSSKARFRRRWAARKSPERRWFAKDAAPPALLQWMVFVHDISFIVTGCMFLLHIYLGVFHPVMTEALKSMTGDNSRVGLIGNGPWPAWPELG